jgi:hypothetical protein
MIRKELGWHALLKGPGPGHLKNMPNSEYNPLGGNLCEFIILE